MQQMRGDRHKEHKCYGGILAEIAEKWMKIEITAKHEYNV